MRPLKILLIICTVSFIGCGRGSSEDHVKLFTDINGFVLNSGSKNPILMVGVGWTGEKFIKENKYLENSVLLPKKGENNLVNEMRFNLEAQSDLYYTDGDLKLHVCAHSASADGSKIFRYGVAFVGIKLCESPINDYKRAIQVAHEVMTQLEKENPNITNLRDFYRTASQSELNKIGGELWENIATKHFVSWPVSRDRPDSHDYLLTPEEAIDYFANKIKNPKFENDINGFPRLQGGQVLVGVYAGKYAIFEIGINAMENWGGQHLTKEQLDEQRYDVTMHFRLRSDVDPNVAFSK